MVGEMIGHCQNSMVRVLVGEVIDYNNNKKVSEYDLEIPQSQTADNPMAQRGIAVQPSRDTRKTN